MMMMMMMMMRKQVLSNGSLAVSEVYMEDSGMYGCTAENSGGSRRAELHLHVTSRYPLKPGCLHLQSACLLPASTWPVEMRDFS